MSRMHWSEERVWFSLGKGDGFMDRTLCKRLVTDGIATDKTLVTCKACKAELLALEHPVAAAVEESLRPSLKPPLVEEAYPGAWCTEAVPLQAPQARPRFRDVPAALRWYVDIALAAPAPTASYAFNCLGDVNLELSATGVILTQADIRARLSAMRDKPWPFCQTNAVPTVAQIERCSDYKVEIDKALKSAFRTEESRRGLQFSQCVEIVLERVAGRVVTGQAERARASAAELAQRHQVDESVVVGLVKRAKKQVYVELRFQHLIEEHADGTTRDDGGTQRSGGHLGRRSDGTDDMPVV